MIDKNKTTLSKKELEEFDHVLDILELPNNLKIYTIHEVMDSEGEEFVVGSMNIVKCENGLLRIKVGDNEWSDIYMTRSYLDADYIKLED